VVTSTGAKTAHICNTSLVSANATGISSANVITFAIVSECAEDQSFQTPSPMTTGIQRKKSLARNYAYWPEMDHDVEDLVHLCGPCTTKAANKSLSATLH
jgi:hypothetical protein